MSKKRGCLGATIISFCVLLAIGIIGSACDGSSGKDPVETVADIGTETIKIIDETTTGDDTVGWIYSRFNSAEPVTETETCEETETAATDPEPVETQPKAPETEKPKPETKATEPTKPSTPKSSVTIISDPSPVTRNEEATLTVKGTPNEDARIYVYYSSGASKAKGLEGKTTDADGVVSWTWKVGGKTNAGTYSITVVIGDDKIEIPLIVKE